MTLTIRTMSSAEIGLALDWAAAEGWNPGLGDADPFHVTDPGGFLIGTVDGEPAAIISVVRYPDSFAFLGFYIVHPAHRGRGHGWAVWQAGMARLEGCTVGLDGVVAQQDNYRKSGFAYAWPNYRFGGTIEPRPDAAFIDARTVPFDRLLALDAALFPAPRPAFLAAWLAMPNAKSLALVQDGDLVALGMLRRCRTGCKLGPVYAPDAAIAERLIRALAVEANGAPTSLDVVGRNDPALKLAQDLGLTVGFETARMYRGPAPTVATDRLFGITTFELG
ncbi:MAG: GNAT family N-acetyltransferase [Geminicoccaceae bacterium]